MLSCAITIMRDTRKPPTGAQDTCTHKYSTHGNINTQKKVPSKYPKVASAVADHAAKHARARPHIRRRAFDAFRAVRARNGGSSHRGPSHELCVCVRMCVRVVLCASCVGVVFRPQIGWRMVELPEILDDRYENTIHVKCTLYTVVGIRSSPPKTP